MYLASPKAQALYSIFAAEVFHARSRKIDLTRGQLAALMGFSPRRPQSVDPYITELESIGAIDTVRGTTPDGMKDRNTYVVHHEPPDTYIGPRTYAEFYRARLAGDAEPAGASAVVRSSAHRAEQRKEGKAAGRSDVRETAHTLRREKGEFKTPPTPQRSASTGAPAEAEERGDRRQGNSDHESLVDEVLRERPLWFSSDVNRALMQVADRDPELVRAAFLIVAKDPTTQAPGRLAQSGPWWDQAAAHLAKVGSNSAGPFHCGNPLCNPKTHLVEDEDGNLIGRTGEATS